MFALLLSYPKGLMHQLLNNPPKMTPNCNTHLFSIRLSLSFRLVIRQQTTRSRRSAKRTLSLRELHLHLFTTTNLHRYPSASQYRVDTSHRLTDIKLLSLCGFSLLPFCINSGKVQSPPANLKSQNEYPNRFFYRSRS